MFNRVANNAKAVHCNIKTFLKNEFIKLKEQENSTLVLNFLLFVFGIATSYFGVYWLSIAIAVVLLALRLRSKAALVMLGVVVMQVDSVRHSQHLIERQHKNVEITAMVEKSSERECGSRKYTVSHIKVLNKKLKIDGKLMVYCNMCRGREIPPNSVVSMKATLVSLPESVYPTGYNVKSKYKFQGYSGFAFVNKMKIITAKPPKDMAGIVVGIRSFFMRKLNEIQMPSQVQAIAEAMFLGEKSRISKKTNDDLRKVGLSHVVAISGMHISIMMMLCYQVF
ncbi:MAG: ComEC/Rec2 family competence protein, partial [Proteobacteria bacterium]|nr:ComEC/Rec2 family competence protein [Pseudomonadota bacterium]